MTEGAGRPGTVARLHVLDGGIAPAPARSMCSPGHRPGRCSLLVRLARTGPVLLSADVAPDRYNVEHRCVPAMNDDADASRRSMERVVALVRDEAAQLWLNHDTAQSATIAHAPAFFD